MAQNLNYQLPIKSQWTSTPRTTTHFLQLCHVCGNSCAVPMLVAFASHILAADSEEENLRLIRETTCHFSLHVSLSYHWVTTRRTVVVTPSGCQVHSTDDLRLCDPMRVADKTRDCRLLTGLIIDRADSYLTAFLISIICDMLNKRGRLSSSHSSIGQTPNTRNTWLLIPSRSEVMNSLREQQKNWIISLALSLRYVCLI